MRRTASCIGLAALFLFAGVAQAGKSALEFVDLELFGKLTGAGGPSAAEATAPDLYAHDDGEAEVVSGWYNFPRPPVYCVDSVMLVKFDTADKGRPVDAIESLGIQWGLLYNRGGDPRFLDLPPNSATLYIWDDTDENGDPNDGLVLLGEMKVVNGAFTQEYEYFELPSSVSVSGVFFVGVRLPHVQPETGPGPTEFTLDWQYVAMRDRSSVSGNSWWNGYFCADDLPTDRYPFDSDAPPGMGAELRPAGGEWMLRAQSVDLSEIPTVSQWGLVVLGLLLLVAGTIVIRRTMIQPKTA